MSPYEILGVGPEASDEEISRTYKQLAKRYHPDLNPGDAAAAERMGQINRAYDEIRSMRQRGADPFAGAYRPGQGYGPAYGRGYGNPYDAFFTGRTYYYTYRPRRGPIGAILIVMVMFFIMRLLLSLLFSGYGYMEPSGYYRTMPGYYGYYQTVPQGDN